MQRFSVGTGFWVGGLIALSGCASAGPGDETGAQAAAVAGGTPDTTDSEIVAVFRENAPIIVSSACTGTLIAPNLVLTARHCIEDFTGLGCGTQFKGAVYSHVWVTTAPDSSVSNVKLYKAAKVLRPNTDGTFCGNDLALIVLIDSIPGTEATPRAPLVSATLSPGDPISAVGYGGIDQNQTGKGIRRRADGFGVACVGASCGGGVAAEWIGNEPLCPGDSGGPALDASGRVAGVASRGDCSTAVYTRTECFGAFLIASAKDAANQAGYAAPAWTSESIGTLDPSCVPTSGTGGSGAGGAGASGGASTGGASTGGASAGGSAGASVGGSAGASAGGSSAGGTGGNGAFGGLAGGSSGGAAGSTSTSPASAGSSSGCSVAPGADPRGLAALLFAVGLALSRRRSARRRS